MTSWSLARRSLVFYLRSHLGTIAGAAIATAVLTGALLVGDSVRASLREMAMARIGRIDASMATGDRIFRASLAEATAKATAGNPQVVPALQLPGTAVNPGNSARANQVQITGVTADFWNLAQTAPTGALASNSVWINERLARQLQVQEKDTILLRVPRVSNLSRDAPLSPEEDSTVAMRLEIGRVLNDDQLGRFSLQASQVPPFNAFVPIELLQQRAAATNGANLLLASQGSSSAEAFAIPFSLLDAQIDLRHQTNTAEAEFRTARVFLDEPIGKAMTELGGEARPIFTYFVNELRLGDRATPYSMVTAATAPLVPADLRPDEIILNAWLAEDLGAKAGDTVAVRYYIMGAMRDLVERTNNFRVRGIAPMELPFADPALMPDFPGMTDADNCRDWDTGFPINTEAIRDKDEAYWDQYRGTPKAFISLAAGQEMWANRFGNLTAVRYPVENTPQVEALGAKLTQQLKPTDLGFVFQPVRQQALAASAGAQDFGGLFIGFSFFLIAAALILMALLFRFALEQRGLEIGTLLALGWPPRRVKRLLLLEGIGLALIGALIGVGGGVFYARAMLHGLTTIWRDAIGNSSLQYHATPVTLGSGFAAGALVALATIWWTLRKKAARPARELLSEGLAPSTTERGARRPRITLAVGVAALGLALILVIGALAKGETSQAGLFFGAGSLVLIAGLLLSSAMITRLETSHFAEQLSLTGMGIRGITRRRTRSRATIGLLACGAFLIASIGAFRLETNRANERSSGTGGFALIGETAIPVVHNLNAEAGRNFFNLAERDVENVRFVPIRVLEGDDASCLNLNRAQRPRVLGVNPALLSERGAFTFSKVAKGVSAEQPWLLLEQELGPDVVPAIGDAASIQYSMGKKVGDTLTYLDQQGGEFQVKIVGAVANSILQGNLLISEKQFIRRFPGQAGYRMFLIDAPSNRPVAETLSRAMQDVGLELTSARERLAAYNAVQNTYLGTFQLLGGLGLLLGSFGLGIVLLRNVFERRSELALLLAVGFRKPALRWLVLSEHAALLLAGLAVGVAAAAIAVLPALLTPGTELPYLQLALTLGAVLLCGLIWTVAASALALRTPLLQALRNE